jgi:hypothetical protein
VVEFIRRFLVHVLPKGFMRIRHYGFLANRCKLENLLKCRQFLQGSQQLCKDFADFGPEALNIAPSDTWDRLDPAGFGTC